MARSFIQKIDRSGEPYVHADDVAEWIESLSWSTDLARHAATYIAQEIRLMGLSDLVDLDEEVL